MHAKKFGIYCQWGARAASPESLAPRFLSTIDQLRRIDPGFDGWNWGNEKELIQSAGEYGNTPLPEIRPWLAEAIAENMRRDDDTHEPDPKLGYRMPAGIYRNSDTQYIHLSISDGDPWPYKSWRAHSDFSRHTFVLPASVSVVPSRNSTRRRAI
jgi:hypothetical protein